MEKNYITPAGLEKLKDELRELIKVERPALVKTVAWAASNGDRSENADYIYGKRRLREIDKRSRYLTKRIEEAEVIDPAKVRSDKVVFGATVFLSDEDGNRLCYSIVGENESDPQAHRVSWKSPLANALLGKKVGDEIVFKRPSGELYLEVLEIQFHPLD